MRTLLQLLAVLVLAGPAMSAPRAYTLQQDGSVVGFTWMFGKDEIQGRMPITDADVTIDFANLERSRVSVSLDVSGAKAGFLFATQALKGPKVLWAEEFPTITFETERVRGSGDRAVLEGLLTIRGVTRPVVLDASLYRQSGTEPGDLSRLTILVEGRVSRSAFGADGWASAVGDVVDLTILAQIERTE